VASHHALLHTTTQNNTGWAHEGRPPVKTFFSDPFVRWLILASILVIVVACGVGFYMDAPAYLGNILAELAGAVLGVFLALLVVERFVRHQRKSQWQTVRELTYRAIAGHLCDVAMNMWTHFAVAMTDYGNLHSIGAGRNRPSIETAKAMASLLKRLEKVPSKVYKDRSRSDVAVEYYEAVKWDIEQIRNVLVPRLIESAEEQDLINALVEFDDAALDLHNAIIAHRAVVTHEAFPDVLNLLDKAGAAYAVLSHTWTVDNGI